MKHNKELELLQLIRLLKPHNRSLLQLDLKLEVMFLNHNMSNNQLNLKPKLLMLFKNHLDSLNQPKMSYNRPQYHKFNMLANHNTSNNHHTSNNHKLSNLNHKLSNLKPNTSLNHKLSNNPQFLMLVALHNKLLDNNSINLKLNTYNNQFNTPMEDKVSQLQQQQSKEKIDL